MQVKSSRVLWPGRGLAPGVITIEGRTIAGVAEAGTGAAIDVGDQMLLPGMIDLHGDAFERQWMPRSGVFFPLDIALLDSDRQLVANGITTAFHGLTVSWEPGLRGIEHGRLMVNALGEMRDSLLCDTKLHLRHEIFALNEIPEIIEWIEAGMVHLIGFNDHIEMIVAKMRNPAKGAQYAERSGLSMEEFGGLLDQMLRRREEVWAGVEAVAAAGRKARIPMASHDDETPQMAGRYRGIGCGICEFPLDAATARAAIDGGQEVILGGPNVVRGKSHTRRLSAIAAFREGLGTVLTSDYYYPSMLHGVLRLVTDEVMSIAKAWELVSSRAAQAGGLTDRGRIEEGLLADLIVVDDRNPRLPRVSMTIAQGRVAHLADPRIWNG